MSHRIVSSLLFASLVAVTFPALSVAAEAPIGLVAVQTYQFDQLALRPGADLASYRKVMIDPVRVQFHKDWKARMNDNRDVAHRVDDAEAKRIADDMASGAAAVLADQFRARGYTIVTAPGAGVLHLIPSITELYVNAPDIMLPGKTRTFTREAGDAVLVLEARDATADTLLARTVYRATAQTNGNLNATTDASNQFWFDAMFRRWAGACADEFASGRKVAMTR
jgi:hypothetical protein